MKPKRSLAAMCLVKLMRGATLEDWCFLWSLDDMQPSEYYNREQKCVLPIPDAWGWPLQWLAKRFHHKHAWASSALPSWEKFRQEMRLFDSKLRWRWVFRNSAIPEARFRVPGVKAPVCSEIVAPELAGWLSRFWCDMSNEFAVQRERARANRSFCNVIPLTKFAVQRLHDLGLTVVVNDKYPGITFSFPFSKTKFVFMRTYLVALSTWNCTRSF